MEWQPIETAPKDGKEILLLGVDCQTYTKTVISHGSWKIDAYDTWETVVNTETEVRKILVHREEGYWSSFAASPTHWMPLPSPPTAP